MGYLEISIVHLLYFLILIVRDYRTTGSCMAHKNVMWIYYVYAQLNAPHVSNAKFLQNWKYRNIPRINHIWILECLYKESRLHMQWDQKWDLTIKNDSWLIFEFLMKWKSAHVAWWKSKFEITLWDKKAPTASTKTRLTIWIFWIWRVSQIFFRKYEESSVEWN